MTAPYESETHGTLKLSTQEAKVLKELEAQPEADIYRAPNTIESRLITRGMVSHEEKVHPQAEPDDKRLFHFMEITEKGLDALRR